MALIAVTGASGFIGRQFQLHCSERGHEVRVIARCDLERGGAHSYAGANAVVHLAARAHVLDETEINSVEAYRRANVELTQRVFLDSLAAGVKRFVFMSSAGVLGNASPPAGFTDDSPTSPHDEYSRSKVDAERWLLAHRDDGVVKVLVRPPLVHGPGARGNFGRIVRAAERGYPLPVGGLYARRGMVGVRNLCDFTLVAALDPRAVTSTYLVSDEQTLSVRELTIALRQLFGRTGRVPWVPASVLAALLRVLGRGADAARLTQPFELQPTRARKTFGWRPPYTCAQELSWAVEQIARPDDYPDSSGG
ncbi:MAG TPA: NAD-dependent epimerase/dehydratase family protein [Steroidobacteraceae bacterium]|jgi:UDP-glucose 4-epimerase|nr:NAD-dependent epimerase/dehydratase family protein [Steroidobacteraceae bacterium]